MLFRQTVIGRVNVHQTLNDIPCLKKACHYSDYIFDDNFNKNGPTAIIFGTLVTQTIGHRTVVSFFPPHNLVQLSYFEKRRTRNSQISLYAAT